MTIIIFIIILLVLVVVHEAGHFFAAKSAGVRVDEFAFGFPPKVASIKKGETTYAFNAIPLGGYVKIHGENGEEENEVDKKRSFVHKHPLIKIFILAAGVIMNLILAFLLVTASTYHNASFAVDRNTEEYKTFVNEKRIKNERTMIANIVKDSPAELAGLKVGDTIQNIFINNENASGHILLQKSIDLDAGGEEITENVSQAINNTDTKFNDSITLVYKNLKGETGSTTIAGVYNLNGNTDKKMIGVSFAKVADINLKLGEAIKIGWSKTWEFVRLTLFGFKDLFLNLFTQGSLPKDISGPVGIFGMVGEARTLGLNYLLLFSAVLSISLAIFNILPFPALDGGRILFVIIEWISGKKIPNKWQNILNTAGFMLLILLMVVITVKDVLKIF